MKNECQISYGAVIYLYFVLAISLTEGLQINNISYIPFEITLQNGSDCYWIHNSQSYVQMQSDVKEWITMDMMELRQNVTVSIGSIRLTDCCFMDKSDNLAKYDSSKSNCSMAPLIQGKLLITDSVINVTKVQQIWENMINNQQLPPDLALCPLGFNGLFPTPSYLINITKTLKDFNIVSSCTEENGSSHSDSINMPSHGNGGGNHNSMAIFAFYSMLEKLSLGLRVISITSLLLTVTTLLSFRKLRERQSNIIICLLSFNKICRYVFKIIKAYIPGSIIVCKIVMAVDHYFSMSTVLWMTILAIRLYYELIGVYSAIHRMSLSTEKVIFIAGSFAWGVPLIVITVGLLLNSGQYGMMYHRSCATHSKWITATYVYPMFVLVGINVLIFIMICFKVWKLSKERNIPMTFSRFYSIIGLMSLFGLTWLVGILAFFDTSLWRNLSHLLFAILAGSQGFLIFVFYCVVKREVRNCWAKTFFKQIDKNTFTMSNRSGTDTNLQSLSSKSKLSKNNAVHPSPNGHFTF